MVKVWKPNDQSGIVSMKTIRAFIAIGLPHEIVTALSQTSQQLAGQISPTAVRWVKPEAMHLTLKFLGETAVSALPAIIAELDSVAAQHTAFRLQLDQLGCFPNPKRPRVIWAGVQGAVREAQALKQAIDQALSPLGWEPESKPFQPHLTLGRVKESRAAGALPWGQKLATLAWSVTAVYLIESQLQPAGSLYTVRHTSYLASPE